MGSLVHAAVPSPAFPPPMAPTMIIDMSTVRTHTAPISFPLSVCVPTGSPKALPDRGCGLSVAVLVGGRAVSQARALEAKELEAMEGVPDDASGEAGALDEEPAAIDADLADEKMSGDSSTA